MKTHTFVKSMIFPGLMFMASQLYAIDFISIDSQTPENTPSFISSVQNQTGSATKNSFLSDEALNLSFQLNFAQEDIGFLRSLYLVAKLDDQFYMKTANGYWWPWDGQAASLQAFSKKQLGPEEIIDVLDSKVLPAGEYQVFIGYQDANNNIKYNRSPATFIVTDKNASALHRIKSASFLSDYLNYSPTEEKIYSAFPSPSIGSSLSGVSASSTDSPSQAANVSQTNLQEAGVDESDTIKTIGDTLFALEKCTSSSSDSSVSKDALFAPIPQNQTCLTSYHIQETPASATQLDQKELKNSGYDKGSILLNGSTNSTKPDRLVWLSSNMSYNIWTTWGSPGYWTDNSTTLKFFDISDPKSLTIVKTLSLDGALITSRRIGDQLYVITRKNHFAIIPLAETTQNDSKTSLPLPNIAIDGGAKQSLVEATDCFVPASRSDQVYDGTIVTITSLSINNPDDFNSTCIVGNIETAYVSTQALYLATSRYPYLAVNNTITYNQASDYSTEIHKFAFTDNHVSYKNSGTVPGHLGWEIDKKPFRMGEHNDILKVATSLGESWNMNSKTRVAVLQENSSGNALEEISFLDNLGKPGERLYAARFIGNRGYLVTFRVTDPLYMLDFTEPESPKILGELEIDGYSDYLHPIGENYLLGIGKDAIADNSATDFAGRGAWYQGIKLSLFDVSDGEHLNEVQSIVIGKRGSSSAVLTDHHALAWLATDDPDSFRLAIPIDEHSTENDWSDYNQPSAFYKWTKTGAYVFDIQTGNAPNLNLSGHLITESLENDDQQTYSFNDRVILQGDSLHFIHDNSVYSSAINDLN